MLDDLEDLEGDGVAVSGEDFLTFRSLPRSRSSPPRRGDDADDDRREEELEEVEDEGCLERDRSFRSALWVEDSLAIVLNNFTRGVTVFDKVGFILFEGV